MLDDFTEETSGTTTVYTLEAVSLTAWGGSERLRTSFASSLAAHAKSEAMGL